MLDFSIKTLSDGTKELYEAIEKASNNEVSGTKKDYCGAKMDEEEQK